ncbi:MAG: hypothetical protein NVSMB2_06280 [Chloroflexota bacterium]
MSDAHMRVETLPGEVKISVPDSLELLTPYVLREQEDWFEDEIKFLRRVPLSGTAAIDIGANYGVYALTLAHLVGPRGRVWAFEPEPATAAHLRRSIELNTFAHVALFEVALSDHSGQAELFVPENSELSSLHVSADTGPHSTRIAVRTLDAFAREWDGRSVQFVKLDAEGEELSILRGGDGFFADHSPLVMFELKHGDAVHVELIDAFRSFGYGTYELLPGLEILAPFAPGITPDLYRLNLFACKPDRAAELEQAGLLASVASDPGPCSADVTSTWNALAEMPYGGRAVPRWQAVQDHRAGYDHYLLGLGSYIAAHTASDVNPADRVASLRQALADVQASLEQAETFPRLQSLARIAWELGQRATAVATLDRLVGMAMGGLGNTDEPFVPVSPRFDLIDPGSSLPKWMLAACVEQREKLRAFSSYFSGRSGLPSLRLARSLGYADAEVQRRLRLLEPA